MYSYQGGHGRCPPMLHPGSVKTALGFGHLRSYYCLLQLQYVKTTTEQRLSPTQDHNPTVFLQLPYSHSPTTTRRLGLQDKNLLEGVCMANGIIG
jgi:hypothetical protein